MSSGIGIASRQLRSSSTHLKSVVIATLPAARFLSLCWKVADLLPSLSRVDSSSIAPRSAIRGENRSLHVRQQMTFAAAGFPRAKGPNGSSLQTCRCLLPRNSAAHSCVQGRHSLSDLLCHGRFL